MTDDLVITYCLRDKDLLHFQMYAAGGSVAVQRRLQLMRWWVPIGMFFVGGLLWVTDARPAAVAAVTVAIIFMCWAPRFVRGQHRRHFKLHIAEKCQGMLNETATLRLGEDAVHSSLAGADTTIPYANVSSVAYTEQLYLILLKQGVTLLVPRAELPDEVLQAFMQDLAARARVAVDDHTQRPWVNSIR